VGRASQEEIVSKLTYREGHNEKTTGRNGGRKKSRGVHQAVEKGLPQGKVETGEVT